jgi:hypothetical protein
VCEPCEQNRIELRAQDFANLNFADAAVRWLEDRKAFIRPKTYHEYKLCIGNLNKFFGQLRLIAIHIGMLLSYQQERMEVEEEERLFRIAATNENWSVAYWASILSNNTSATGCELRALQVKHIHIDTVPPFIEISADPVKNEFRGRTIPLNHEALGAIKWLLKRLRALGGGQFDDYLFPFRVKRNCYALNRSASPQFIRSSIQWDAGCRRPSLANSALPEASDHYQDARAGSARGNGKGYCWARIAADDAALFPFTDTG